MMCFHLFYLHIFLFISIHAFGIFHHDPPSFDQCVLLCEAIGFALCLVKCHLIFHIRGFSLFVVFSPLNLPSNDSTSRKNKPYLHVFMRRLRVHQRRCCSSCDDMQRQRRFILRSARSSRRAISRRIVLPAELLYLHVFSARYSSHINDFVVR